MFCKKCGNKLIAETFFCNNCGEKISIKKSFDDQKKESAKKMPIWLKIILIILWVIVFSLSMQIRKQFIVGGLVGAVHAGFFLYLLTLIVKR